MPVPRFDQLMNPCLQALHDLGGSASIHELESRVGKTLGLSDEEASEIHRGNVTKLGYNLAWARNYLKNYGLLENSSRGVWALTPEGRKVKQVNKEQVKRVVKTRQAEERRKRGETEGRGDSDGEEELSWRNELLDVLKTMPPASFEMLAQRFLREAGFIEVEVTGKSGDGGIDGRGVLRMGGLLSFRVAFQCKRYAGVVSAPVIRDFRGAMIGRADRGLLITTGTFSQGAREEAQRDGAPPIDLVDGGDLVESLKQLGLGVKVTTETHEKVEVRQQWFEQFSPRYTPD